MFEKVTPTHPDKVADRIAGAIVDMAYKEKENPRISVEVLMGYGKCHIIVKTDCPLDEESILKVVQRISERKDIKLDLKVSHVICITSAEHRNSHCDDNGIFKGIPLTEEQKSVVESIKKAFFESNRSMKYTSDNHTINILPESSSGCGITNRKLGSDMGDSMTGGGIHGKDLAKPDVSIAIYAWLKAQKENKPVQLSCIIGDEEVDGTPYSEIVEIARKFIKEKGGFEKFAEWGLID